jgi:hypothetical protein
LFLRPSRLQRDPRSSAAIAVSALRIAGLEEVLIHVT